MPTYITLVNYTDQGIRDMKNAPARIEAARKLSKSLGGQVKAFYLTLGGYDAVVISEAPDDRAVAKMALTIGAAGNVRTATLRAFDEAEAVEIMRSLD